MSTLDVVQPALFGVPEGTDEDLEGEAPDLAEGTWSRSVALDPKHRPQTYDRPSSTVRREWCRSPQEAHLLDLERSRYRRLSPDEIAILQGFAPEWFDVPGMRDWHKVQAAGDAVPPPLASAVLRGVDHVWQWKRRTAVEICAGAGGLASAVGCLAGFEHRALVERWGPACEILRRGKPWDPKTVVEADVSDFDFDSVSGSIGLLSGGPPCQPWSQAGEGRGFEDDRDLLGRIHEIVAVVRPEVFVFENVPGLASKTHRPYLDEVLANLRAPDSGLRYGVLAGVLNAADFGVPQLRRRMFLIGFCGAPSSLAFQAFDAIVSLATHRNPAIADGGRERWRTVGDALGQREDPGGWLRWTHA